MGIDDLMLYNLFSCLCFLYIYIIYYIIKNSYWGKPVSHKSVVSYKQYIIFPVEYDQK